MTRPRGLSVIEVLVATSVLAVAIMAISGMFPLGYVNVHQAGLRTRAVAIAREKIEAARSVIFPPTSGTCPGTVPSGFTCALAVTLANTAPNRLATVTVTVNWTGSRNGSVSLTTRIAE